MFSFKRFLALLKRDLMINKYPLMGYMLIMAGVVAVMMVFTKIPIPTNSVISDVFTMFYLFFNIGCMIMACTYPFKSYDKKYNRAEMILLPASIEEKFAVNFVLAFILVPVIQFVSLFIGMEIGHLINWIRFDNYTLLYGYSLYDFSKYYNWVMVYVFMGFSFFGAVFFQKNKLIKTWAIVFGLMLLVSIGFAIFIVNMDYEAQSLRTFFNTTALKIVVQIAMHVVFVLCVVGTYFQLRKERS